MGVQYLQRSDEIAGWSSGPFLEELVRERGSPWERGRPARLNRGPGARTF